MEAIAADTEVDEGGLDARLDIDDASLVDVAHVALGACALHVKLFENAVLDDRDTNFLRLEAVDQHFFLHVGPFGVHLRNPQESAYLILGLAAKIL